MMFFIPIILSLAFAIANETGLVPAGEGIREGSKTAEIIITAVMELITIANIPLALRLFRFKSVAEALKGSPENLLRFGTIRMTMLTTPLLINTVLYYLFLSTAFGYLAIILLLSMIFIYPSESRCNNETI